MALTESSELEDCGSMESNDSLALVFLLKMKGQSALSKSSSISYW